MTVICENCKKPFEAQRTSARFCSDKCRVQHNRKKKESDAYFDVRSTIYRISKDMEKTEAIETLKNLKLAIDDVLSLLEKNK